MSKEIKDFVKGQDFFNKKDIEIESQNRIIEKLEAENKQLKKALSDNFKRIEGRDTKILNVLEQLKVEEPKSCNDCTYIINFFCPIKGLYNPKPCKEWRPKGDKE